MDDPNQDNDQNDQNDPNNQPDNEGNDDNQNNNGQQQDANNNAQEIKIEDQDDYNDDQIARDIMDEFTQKIYEDVANKYEKDEFSISQKSQVQYSTEKNVKIFRDLLQDYRTEIYNYFYELSGTEQGQEPFLKALDIPMAMRISFYNANILFHETASDKEELFNKKDTNREIQDQLTGFWALKKNKNVQDIEITTIRVSFGDFIEFVEHFLRSEQHLYLSHERDEEYVVERTLSKQQQEQLLVAQKAQQQDDAENPLLKEIEGNIARYEKLRENCKDPNEKISLGNILHTLYYQAEDLINKQNKKIIEERVKANEIASKELHGISSNRSKESKIKKKPITKDSIRQKHLTEIFDFYGKQMFFHNHKMTFERMGHEAQTQTLPNFLLFCKQFKVLNYNKKLNKQGLTKIFQKTSGNYKELVLDEFKASLEQIAIIMYEDQDETMPQMSQKAEAFYQYVGIDDRKYFLNQMQLLQNPFGAKEKMDFRTPKVEFETDKTKKDFTKLNMSLIKHKMDYQQSLLTDTSRMMPVLKSTDRQGMHSPLPSIAQQQQISQPSPSKYQNSGYYKGVSPKKQMDSIKEEKSDVFKIKNPSMPDLGDVKVLAKNYQSQYNKKNPKSEHQPDVISFGNMKAVENKADNVLAKLVEQNEEDPYLEKYHNGQDFLLRDPNVAKSPKQKYGSLNALKSYKLSAYDPHYKDTKNTMKQSNINSIQTSNSAIMPSAVYSQKKENAKSYHAKDQKLLNEQRGKSPEAYYGGNSNNAGSYGSYQK